ncbi:GTP pyrophosphokinase [Labilithrix luteola]|uniref:GTP pyrophosphokinase n=1 Tax=Labilithrix luteola TaxID=1391654 RepID=A0A0K1QEW7_9BACT|nr:HD domain-containing protein [Labilithrix luteola]AKV04311.1 GTP pyrophosphokinase [Labilithrix luteola]
MATVDSDELERDARALAEARHATQRYGDRPYVFHLDAVREVLRSFDIQGDLAVAAWLHDVLEDTATSREELRTRFGADVDELVWAVTGIGATRKERNASAYAKIRATPRAAYLKLADRIANVEAGRDRPDKLAMYRTEQHGFERALEGLGSEDMWNRLRRALGEPTK